MTDLIPAARPVPSPEDRMRDARTDRDYADRIPAPRPLTTDRTNSQTRAVRELLADLADAGNTIDAAQAALSRAGITNPAAEVGDLIGELAAQRDEARASLRDAMAELRDRTRDWREALDARNVLRQQLDQAQQRNRDLAHLLSRKRDTISALAAELGDAHDLIAEIRNNRANDDRAFARWETRQPGQQPPSSVPPRRAQEDAVERAARELHADNYRDRDATTDAHAADIWPRLLDVERAQWIAKAERVLRAAVCP